MCLSWEPGYWFIYFWSNEMCVCVCDQLKIFQGLYLEYDMHWKKSWTQDDSFESSVLLEFWCLQGFYFHLEVSL